MKKSIFSSDGPLWQHSRDLFRPHFSRDNINGLHATDKACTTLMIAIGPANSTGWTPVARLRDLLYNFTMDIATDFLLGESVESQAAAMTAAKDERSAATL
jgi:cytochrome P450